MARKSPSRAVETPTATEPEAPVNGNGRHEAAQHQEVNGDSDGNRPCYSVRLKHIRGAVWANVTDRGTMLTAQVTRLYKRDGDDTWYTSTSFSAEDLLLVAEVCRLCSVEMFMLRQSNAPF